MRHGIDARGGIAVVHNGIPDDAPRRCHDQAAGPVRLLMVGRHAPQKDHETLFRALARLRDKSWTLDLVGTGPDEDRHKALACELGLAQRVQFLGYRKDVPELMAAADVYVLISRWEGLPLSIIEAMRAGLPTVGSNVGGCREMVLQGETGYLAARGDAASVARHLATLIDNRDQLRRLGTAARRRFEEEFTLETMFDRTVSTYRTVLARHQPSAF
jgi:glycosyltransferase involved in cell wall biosynthesis